MVAEQFTCSQCGQTFGSSDKLEQHNRQMHMSGGMKGLSGEMSEQSRDGGKKL